MTHHLLTNYKMRPTKKIVHFAPAEKLEEVHEISTSQEHEMLYLSCLDLEALKQTCLVEAIQARKMGLDKHLECTFTDASEDVHKRLQYYTRHHECRGLERMISKSHYDERKHHREQAVKAVLIGQTMAREKGMDPDEVREQLRTVALVYCIDAKVFARRLGKADEAACNAKRSCHHHHRKVEHMTETVSNSSFCPLKLALPRVTVCT